MHIGIVLHPFGDSAKGLEQYVYETTRSIIEGSKDKTTFTVFVKGNPDVSGLPKGTTVIHFPDVFYWHLYFVAWYKKCDAFVFFTESAPLFLWRESIIVFFDAAYFYFGSHTLYGRIQRKVLVWWRKNMMRSARHVVAISEASKRDLVEKYQVPHNHVTVIYPGFKALNTGLMNGGAKTPPQPFFMYIGPMKERKNVLRIVEAYIAFRKTTRFTHHLYLVGRKTEGAYESSIRTCIKESGYADSIFFKTDVDDTALEELYTTTTALVYPSLLEGFGLPILEALSCGAIVITSKTTSTCEVLGDAGILVDPYSVEEIQNAMVQIAEGNYDAEKCKKEGEAQCQRFSWAKSAEEWRELFLDGAIIKGT